MSPTEIAAELEVASRTVCRWIDACLNGERSPLKVDEIRTEEPNGAKSRRYWIEGDAVDRLVAEKIGRPDPETK